MMVSQRSIFGWVCVLVGIHTLLLACSSQPHRPQWRLEALDTSQRAVAAYLQGQTRVAQVEWSKAFATVSATGESNEMARIALLQCAAQTAALEWTDCPRYLQYAQGAGRVEKAYARYLQNKHTAADIALLPVAQQASAWRILNRQPMVTLPHTEPLSQLTAAGVALQAGAISYEALAQTANIAAEQGWRRAAIAWLSIQKSRVQKMGDTQALQDLELRIQILEE